MLECRDLRLGVLKKISCLGVIVELSSLKLPYPDSDEVARDVVSARESMESWAICRLNSMLWERCLAMASIL